MEKKIALAAVLMAVLGSPTRPAAENVVGNPQHVIGFVIRQVDLQQVHVPLRGSADLIS